MAFDPVPWFVGGGAQHSPEVARTFAYAATNGAEGVVQGADLKVTPTTVPGNTVRVAIGAVVILNRAAGQTAQSYIGRVNTADSATIAATTSAGKRSDLVVAQVEDPWLNGEPWQDPTDPTQGPYIFVRVISNVPAGTTRLQDVPGYEGRSAVTLARIDVPASTSTITAAMITDLRKVAIGRSFRRMLQTTTTSDTYTDASAQNTFVPFPQDSITSWPVVAVPSWATQVNLRGVLIGVYSEISPLDGQFVARIGTSAAQSTPWTYFNEQTQGDTRKTYIVEGTVDIPASMRGTNQTLRIYVQRLNGTGRVHTKSDAQVKWDVEFIEGIQ